MKRSIICFNLLMQLLFLIMEFSKFEEKNPDICPTDAQKYYFWIVETQDIIIFIVVPVNLIIFSKHHITTNFNVNVIGRIIGPNACFKNRTVRDSNSILCLACKNLVSLSLHIRFCVLQARLDILKIHSRKMNLTRGINLRKIAEMMPGASGAEVKVTGFFVVVLFCFVLRLLGILLFICLSLCVIICQHLNFCS